MDYSQVVSDRGPSDRANEEASVSHKASMGPGECAHAELCWQWGARGMVRLGSGASRMGLADSWSRARLAGSLLRRQRVS
jgi:hypothetical protein